MKAIFLLGWMLLGSFSPSPARAGNDGGGGGDSVALEFAAQGEYIFSILTREPDSMRGAPELNSAEFYNAISSTLVESTDERLMLGDREVDAINYPARRWIRVNRARWFATGESSLLRITLVLHEYLGIMGKDDSHYQISSPFLNWLRRNNVPPRSDGPAARPDPSRECVSGTWTMGRAPLACRASAYGPDSSIFLAYGDHIFYDDRPRDEETKRYVSVMHATLKETAEFYLSQRKATTSEEERANWVRLVMAMAQQESLWSHYRLANDGGLKIHFGDSLHGQGITGIDDRAHSGVGLAGDLMVNLRYAMDILYAFWEKAPKAACVAGVSDWRGRARSAYSGYNGGLSKLCRFNDPKSPYRSVDLNFATNFDFQPWLRNVGNEAARSTLNIPCLLSGGLATCGNPRR